VIYPPINKEKLQTGGNTLFNYKNNMYGKEIINYFINNLENKKNKLLIKFII
jgi:hypothetical protein